MRWHTSFTTLHMLFIVGLHRTVSVLLAGV